MTRCLVVAFAGILVGGCSLSSGLDEEIETSIKFDDIECAELVSQRDAIAASYGVLPAAERDPVMKERRRILGPAAGYIPDLRSQQTKDTERAKGQIEAMNGSLLRRRC